MRDITNDIKVNRVAFNKMVRRDRKQYKHKEYPFIVANIDRRIVGKNSILECKTANQYLLKEWEDEEIPASYLLQV